jgi:hypothetical protein
VNKKPQFAQYDDISTTLYITQAGLANARGYRAAVPAVGCASLLKLFLRFAGCSRKFKSHMIRKSSIEMHQCLRYKQIRIRRRIENQRCGNPVKVGECAPCRAGKS